ASPSGGTCVEVARHRRESCDRGAYLGSEHPQDFVAGARACARASGCAGSRKCGCHVRKGIDRESAKSERLPAGSASGGNRIDQVAAGERGRREAWPISAPMKAVVSTPLADPTRTIRQLSTM